jgi:hypothetical protein
MGGHVAKKLGDGLMALFGYPVAQENDAERAVRAALAIQRALEGEVIPLIHHQFRVSYFIQIQKSPRLKVITCWALYPASPKPRSARACVCAFACTSRRPPPWLHSWGFPA